MKMNETDEENKKIKASNQLLQVNRILNEFEERS
jgi:hypothetical protein